MLEKVSARKKLLILTDSEFYKIFKRYSDGKISNEIEIVLLANKIVAMEPLGAKPMPSLNKAENSKKTDFDTFWSELTSLLSTKQHITNWTILKGQIGEDFYAAYLGGNYIVAYPESAGIQRIPKTDFKIIYEKWDGYTAKLIPRSHFVHGPVATSRFTKYTISIIHQYLCSKRK